MYSLLSSISNAGDVLRLPTSEERLYLSAVSSLSESGWSTGHSTLDTLGAVRNSNVSDMFNDMVNMKLFPVCNNMTLFSKR